MTISALERLVAGGAISPDDETVALITGMGLKTLEALGEVQPTCRIAPSIEALEEALDLS